jgi:hypothetical protein
MMGKTAKERARQRRTDALRCAGVGGERVPQRRDTSTTLTRAAERAADKGRAKRAAERQTQNG